MAPQVLDIRPRMGTLYDAYGRDTGEAHQLAGLFGPEWDVLRRALTAHGSCRGSRRLVEITVKPLSVFWTRRSPDAGGGLNILLQVEKRKALDPFLRVKDFRMPRTLAAKLAAV